MVQIHLRKNPYGTDRGSTSVKNLEIEELITHFKNSSDMHRFMKDKGKKAPPLGIFNSNTKSIREGNANTQKQRCDKCKALDIQCSMLLNHCKEKGHQKGQSYTDSNPKMFYTKKNCLHCLAQLQRNIAKAKQERLLPTPLMSPPQEKAKCDKCMYMNRSCPAKFNHCRLLGHQGNQPQGDKNPSTWNNKDSCPFCTKETRKTRNKVTPVNSIVDEPPPPIPTLPMIPIRPVKRSSGINLNKATPLMAPFQNKTTPLIGPFQSQGIPPFSRDKNF